MRFGLALLCVCKPKNCNNMHIVKFLFIRGVGRKLVAHSDRESYNDDDSHEVSKVVSLLDEI